MANGDEIFDKDCLNLKQLKKMDKEDLESTIELNLNSLVNYYYEDLFRKEERPYREMVNDLVLSKKLFLKPILKIHKHSEESIPSGLAFMMYDNLNQGNISTNIAIEQLRSNTQLAKADIDAKIKELTDNYNDTKNDVMEVLAVLAKKNVKKLKKIGMAKEYAELLAPALISSDYLTVKNCFRFIHTLTNAFYAVFTCSLTKDEDGKTISRLCIDLTDAKVIGKIMNIMTKNMDLGVYAEFIKQILLEKRDRQLDSMNNKPVLNVYNAITVYAEDTLEDKEIFNGKTRQQIIKSFLDQRVRDDARNRDAARRVAFDRLSADAYPRIHKAYDRVIGKEEAESDEE